MTSRRTRSGASLGNSEPRRLRRTPFRKQQKAKSIEDATTYIHPGTGLDHDSSSKDNLELSSGDQVEDSQSKLDSPKKVQLSCSNIWERLAKNSGDLLSNTDVREVVNESHDTDNGRATTMFKKRVPSSDSGGAKKNRKPEILVSLLEGEAAYPISQRKDTIGFGSGTSNTFEDGPDNSNKARGQSVISVGAAGSCKVEENPDGYHVSPSSVCFFHNCDSRKSINQNDFSNMPDVPGEPFFVSLSKDENKELNMVKTSSGTVRVGCSLRKLADHSRSYSESCTKSSLYPATDKSRKIRNLNQIDSAEHTSAKRSGRCLFSSETRGHKARLSEIKDNDWNRRSEIGPDSPLHIVDNKMTISKHVGLELSGENDTKSGTSKSPWRQGLNIVDSSRSEIFQSASEIAEEQKISEITLRSETGFKRGDIHTSNHYKSLTLCRSSHYPLMKEILFPHTYLPQSVTEPSAKYGVKLPEHDNESSDGRHLKSVDTLNLSSKCMVSLTSMLTLDSDLECKNVVKRSERIRCKSGIGKPCGITLHQSVISTMKPADKTFKSKTKTPITKRSPKVCFGRESQRNRSKKVFEGMKKTAVIKGPNDCQKNKTTMSREVIAAIIKSIEETVSGCSEADKNISVSDSPSKDSPVNSFTKDEISGQAIAPSTGNTSRNSVLVDRWSDSTTDHDYDMSTNLSDRSITQANNSTPVSKNRVFNNVSKKTSKLFNAKKPARKTKKTGKTSNKSKSLKVGSARSKIKSLTITTTIEDTPSSVTSTYSTAENASNEETGTPGADAGPAPSTPGKRFRKKTRKAKEAFGDDDVFCDDYWSVKKSKSRNRSGSTSSDSSSSSSHRRPRRSSQMGGQETDPVLEEHAFILWASENRSQVEQQNPGAPSSEVDSILFSHWCEVPEVVKAKFFLRAREAFSDDDRSTFHSSSMTDLEASMFGDLFSESDPVFAEFIRLPIDRQRDMLRRWLKFFQQTLAKKEYMDFIVTFKRACNRDTSSPSGRSKRTRMRCLDPSHYKMLFDMIRLTRPRVLENYKTMLDKDKSSVSDTYSILLLRLVRNEPLPLLEPGCRSQVLTEVLQDLGIPDNVEASPSMDVGASIISSTSTDNNSKDSVFFNGDGGYSDEIRSSVESLASTLDWRANSDTVSKVTLDVKADPHGNDSGFDEADYSLLNSDLALGLLSGLSEASELPLLDQDILDQVFLAPPRMSASFNQPRRAVSLYGRRMDSLPQNLIPLVSRPSSCAPLCLPHLLPTDPMSYPKINIHYASTTVATSGGVVHHLPLRHANILPHKYARRDTRNASPVRGGWCRKNSPLDMHTNSGYMENMIQSPAHFNGPHSKCFKVHAKVMSPQIKLNLQPLQLPLNSRGHQPNKLHPRVIPVSCGLQQRFPTIIYSPTNPALLDKLGSHHINQLGAQSLASSSATSSRMSPQPIGLSNPSPLITSLSPLRGVKYSHSGKSYSPHCQMVPCRPRMQLSAGSSSGHRRTTHTIPISTTHKANISRSHGSLQQIKVCLSTQTLKIPIAKLRESRKTSYIKGKVRNFNMQPNSMEPYTNIPCTQTCQFNMRSTPPTSVLAKVLNFQAVNEMDHLTKMSLAESLSNNTASNSRPVNSTFIGTMCPVSGQSTPSSIRSTTQLHLVSVVSTPSNISDIKTTGSSQATMVVSPMTVNRNSHLIQSSCSSSTGQSKPDLSNCSFLSVTSGHAITTQNLHVIGGNTYVSAKNANHWETGVCSGASFISESHYTRSLFQDLSENNDSTGEFRIVGTRTVGTSEAIREKTSENSNRFVDTLVQGNEQSVYSIGNSNVTGSLQKYTEIPVAKRTPEPNKAFDNKKFTSNSKVVDQFFHAHNQERLKDESTSAASTVSMGSPCVTEHFLNRRPDIMGQLQVTPQTSSKPLLLDSSRDGDEVVHGCGSQDLCHKRESVASPSLRDSLSVPISCGRTSSQDCLSKEIMADTSLLSKDIPWSYRCVPSTSTKDKTCNDREETDTLPDGNTANNMCDTENNQQTTNSLVQPHEVDEDCESSDKNTITLDGSVSVNDDLIYSDNLPTDTTSSLGATNSADHNQHSDLSDTSGSALGNDIHQCFTETNDDFASNGTVNKNMNAVCLPRSGGNRELCEHEYSVGVQGSSRGMMKCIGTTPVTLPSACTSVTSGLHILAETATSARSLLSSRRFVRPASQTALAPEEFRLSKKQEGMEAVVHDPGPTVKKMTMCAVTVQSDTGCILVENLASRDRSTNQPQRSNLDLLSSSGSSCRAATPPLSAANNQGQFTHDCASYSTNVTQLLHLPSRTTVMACSSAHSNAPVALNKIAHSSSSLPHSPNAGRRRPHYTHKYMPT